MRQTDSINVRAYEASARKMLALLLHHSACRADLRVKDKRGVRLHVRRQQQDAGFFVGDLNFANDLSQEEAATYEVNAAEKLERLVAHPEHWSSSESGGRGAIGTANSEFISVDGLSEDHDEALALLIAVDMGLMTPARADWIATQRSNNPHASTVHDILRTS